MRLEPGLLDVIERYALGQLKCPHRIRLLAIALLLDRGWGKPKETLDVNARYTLDSANPGA